MQELAKEFFELFAGSDIAHGTYEVNGEERSDGKQQGQAKVLRQPPTLEHWVEHLQGAWDHPHTQRQHLQMGRNRC